MSIKTNTAEPYKHRIKASDKHILIVPIQMYPKQQGPWPRDPFCSTITSTEPHNVWTILDFSAWQNKVQALDCGFTEDNVNPRGFLKKQIAPPWALCELSSNLGLLQF